MSFPNIKITTKGKQLLTRALTGEAMEFTKFAIGSGVCGNSDDWPNLTGLIAHQMDVPFAEYKREGELVAFAGRFDTSTVERAFWWRELAIYGTIPDDPSVGEVMCFYGNAGDLAEYVHEVGSEVAVTHSWTTKLALSSDADVSAIVSSTSFATTQQLLDHTQNTSNPHKVTKDQLGLGNVKNLAIEDETPVYDESKTLITLRKGEKIKIAFGKIQKAITALIDHLADKKNPHGLTGDAIGAAAKNHRSEGTEHGMGTGAYYGHVKLTDDPTSTATANDGVAITPAGLAKALEEYTPSSGGTGDGGTTDSSTTGGIDQEAIDLAVEQALAKAKESGEFDGEDGQDGVDGVDGKDGTNGRDGVDGVSPTATVSQTAEGAVINVTDANGTTSATVAHGVSPTFTLTETDEGVAMECVDVNGTTRSVLKHGPQGPQGVPGNTPVLGVDYFTDDDKNNLRDELLAELPVVIAEDGYSDFYGLRQPISTAIVRTDKVITMSTTLEGDKVSTTQITLNDEGYPVQVVANGVACTITWEGFEAEEEGSA